MSNEAEPIYGSMPSLEERFDAILLGAAFGDALGWPHEMRATAVKSTKAGFSLQLNSWTKRSGGRFLPHEEHIGSGEYSDDTQLLVAVARARAHHSHWWRYLAEVELPFWTTYQRGGGGASVRAAKLWLKGIAPWEGSRRDKDLYFEAGGNGVAMRVAPHVLVGASDDEFHAIAQCVVADGITTHGHPIALVGALSYAYALWRAVRATRTLEYGQLIAEVTDASSVWGTLPEMQDFWPTWENQAFQVADYHEKWMAAVEQVVRQLRVASDGLSTGALDFDEETMERIGCFDKSILGAGTVAASAAIFLASKYAASPLEGVTRAAFAQGSDTDTIASMTGGLTSAFNGIDWVRPYITAIQDNHFLAGVAQRLAHPVGQLDQNWERFSSSDQQKLIDDLDSSRSDDLTLPLRTRAKVVGGGGVSSKSEKVSVNSWRIRDEAGQTFIIKMVQKTKDSPHQKLELDTPQKEQISTSGLNRAPARLAGVTLSTFDIGSSRHFYKYVLGLFISRDTGKLIQIGDTLVLRQYDVSREVGGGSIVYIEVDDIRACWMRVSQEQRGSPSEISSKAGRASFICNDPDGRMIEIFQR